jgi:hypothetical protein
VGRHLGKTIRETTAGKRLFRRGLRAFETLIGAGISRMTRDEFVNRYTGAKKRKYEQAKEALDAIGLHDRHFVLQAFVKAERRDMDKIKDPRMIQARSPYANIEIGTFIAPIEHKLKATKIKGMKDWWAKGMNHAKVAKVIFTKMQRFRDGVVVSLDCSRFDKHVKSYQLKAVYRLYSKIYDDDPELRWMTEKLIKSRGWTRGGIRYTINGKRASGDQDTSLGNSIIMVAMVIACCSRLGLKYDILNDGDDNLLFIERDSLPAIQQMVEMFREMGHTLTVEKVADKMEDIVFRQSKPVLVGDKWRMIRDPFKVLKSVAVVYKHCQHMKYGLKYLKFVIAQELQLSAGVPLLQPVLASLVAELSHVESLPDATDRFGGYLLALNRVKDVWDIQERPIEASTALSFADAFGIGVAEQDALSKELSTPGLILGEGDWVETDYLYT